MTIKQPRVGSRRDFGMVGFLPDKDVSYLLFPKPLTAFKEGRIIGIKYELISSAPTGGPRVKPLKAAPARPFQPYVLPEPKSRLKGKKEFKVTVRFSASKDVTEVVEADSRKAAARLAVEQAKMPEFDSEKMTRKVVRVQEA